MSRLAKKPITIPSGVDFAIDGQMITAKGPKGQLNYFVHDVIMVQNNDNMLTISAKELASDVESKKQKIDRQFIKAIVGTTCANISNVLHGVSEGFEKKLLLVGVGFRGQVQGKQLNLSLGFSHPVIFDIPEGLTIEMPSQTEIIVKGIDKQLVGQMAADIRAKRPVEPYKGKGVRYSDEVVILKETKKK